jgi:hypothetical protein
MIADDDALADYLSELANSNLRRPQPIRTLPTPCHLEAERPRRQVAGRDNCHRSLHLPQVIHCVAEVGFLFDEQDAEPTLQRHPNS